MPEGTPPPRVRGRLALVAAALVVASVLSLRLGSLPIALPELLRAFGPGPADPVTELIVWELRLPRVLAAVCCGAALAVCGLLLQTLLQNPLAGPSVLGVSAGASLGVAAEVFLGGGSAVLTLELLPSDAGGPRVVAASLGAFAVTALLMGVTLWVRDPVRVLIVGLMIGQLTLAAVGLWQYYSAPEQLREFLVWSFGSLGGVHRSQLGLLAVVSGGGVVLSGLLARPLNTLLLGDAFARQAGVPLRSLRLAVVLVTSLLTGCVTALAGPIGFVGLATPHLARGLYPRADHLRLLPLTALLGALLLVLCDAVAQAPGYATVVPLNVVTALVGAPVVIWVILRPNPRLNSYRT